MDWHRIRTELDSCRRKHTQVLALAGRTNFARRRIGNKRGRNDQWVGSMAGSLIRIDPKTLAGTQIKTPAIYGLLSDGPHRMWMATVNGMYELDPTGPDRQPHPVNDPLIAKETLRFTDMSLDSSGNLWVTSDQGMFKHDVKGWHAIDPGKSGAKPDLLAVDWNGSIWVAGPSQDLMRLRVNGNKVVEAEHIGRPPLMSEEIVSLVVDHRGWLWVGEDAGVTVYDGHRWRSFTQDDGLIWNDTDSFALSEDRDGSMWIGTSGGLSHLIAPQGCPGRGCRLRPQFRKVMLGAVPVTEGRIR